MNQIPKNLRRRFRQRRRALSAHEQSVNADRVARAIAGSSTILSASNCGVYLAFLHDGELDTLPLLSRLWSMSKTVACPVIGRGWDMDFYRVTPTTRLVHNRYGLLEPSTRGFRSGRYLNPRSLSVLFMPLVAFDDSGARLGMGAGYYDRFLGKLQPTLRPLLVGLAHEVQRSDEMLPTNDWDVPLDAVVTEAGWQPFTRRAMVPAHR